MKKTKLVVAIMLTFALCLASISSAFAAQSPNGYNNQSDVDTAITNGDLPAGSTAAVEASGGVGAIESDTPGESVIAVITKVLQMPVGTTIPTASFKFTATAVSVDGVDAATAGNMPALNMPASIDYSPASHGTAATADANTATYTQESEDSIFDGVTFPHAGIYVYDITEDATNSTTFVAGSGQEMVYSPASYKLYVFVANDGIGGLYVRAVSDVVTTVDNSDQTADFKVDPTPGEQGMVFTNTYMHTHLGSITNPNLAVSKKVTGSYADMTLYFPYTMTVKAPDVSYDPDGDLPPSSVTASPVPFTATAPTYKAYILNAAGEIILDPTPNSVTGTGVTVSTTTGLITVTSGEEFTYSLQHGQKLVFIDTPVGATFDVKELGTPSYVPAVDVLGNDAAGTYTSPADHHTAAAGVALDTGAYLVSESVNKADYTNNLPDITPTGLLINNLPYIGLIVLAVGAVVVYVVTKSRKRNRITTKA
ncbi:MAG: hypothetical protein FWD65_00585 [Coriobacteriia bacterium]|nr:hypothetical protein [Coriobacteriia bacterium]